MKLCILVSWRLDANLPSPDNHPLRLDGASRQKLWSIVNETVESYLTGVANNPVSNMPSLETLRQQLGTYTFEEAQSLEDIMDFVTKGLEQQVHTPHPRYFGLFNPAPTTLGIAADTLTATYNPQLAAWSHAPFANEVEQHLIVSLAERFGYKKETASGTFCTGGAEANHTALLTALVASFSNFSEQGLRSLKAQPVFYVTEQSHHSFVKAARFCGLGTDAVRKVPTDAALKMDCQQLEHLIIEDKKQGFAPFMVVATGGTTNAGVIDPIDEIANLAKRYSLWCHLDAAWGGAAVLIPELRSVLSSSDKADSITFDAHKWLSVPMGAGLYLTRHPNILNQSCHISTAYMPNDTDGLAVKDPYTHSLQWSRRFIGLKIFMSLAVAGWDGYADALGHQVAMGELLREELVKAGWKLENETPLPVVCFSHSEVGSSQLQTIAEGLIASGQVWLSTTKLDSEKSVLRACITNFLTDEQDIKACIEVLQKALYS